MDEHDIVNRYQNHDIINQHLFVEKKCFVAVIKSQFICMVIKKTQ